MENFLQAFFAVDTDNSETITREELVSFMKANHFKPAFVEVRSRSLELTNVMCHVTLSLHSISNCK